MNIMNTIDDLMQWESVSEQVVKNLYLYSEKSLRSVIIMSVFVSFVLTQTSIDSVTSIMYLWGMAMTLFSFYRLSKAYQYKKYPQKHTLEKWYMMFVIDAVTLALLANIIVFLVLPKVDQNYQLFILVMYLGLSGGAKQSLSPDYKISFIYQVLTLIPVTVIIVLQGHELNYFAAVIVLVYFITQLNIIKQEHMQNKDLFRKEQEIKKVQGLLEEKQNRLEYFFDENPLAVIAFDKDLIVTDCNIEAVNLLNNDHLVGLDLNELKDKRPLHILNKSLKYGIQVYKGPYRTLSDKELWVEAKCLPELDSENQVVGGILIIENKTKENQAHQELEYQAYHDILTTLSNRRGFMNFIDKMIHTKLHKTHYSLLFYIDLNRFKHINDSLGHAVGDQLLIEVSKRLKGSIDVKSSLSRIGGDEFILVIPFVSDHKATAIREANNFALRIQDIIKEVFIVDNMHLYIKSSIGIVCIDPNTDNIDAIVHQADISMYEAKEHGHNGHISFYNTELDLERKNIFSLQQDLVYGLKNDQFKLSFQPIVNIKDDKIYAAEALIRWYHPKLGVIPPDNFIPLAIDSGAIMDIDWWVIDLVCKQIGQWKKENMWNLQYVSFNLTAQELLRADFVNNFLAKLTEYGVEKSDIIIEITETNLIDNFEDSQDVISILHQYGVRCSIDDFGTGYSSLSYLKRLSFNTLKIDREFIKDIESEAEDILLLQNIIRIGKQFDYDIVVEGVEDQMQKNIITSIDDNVHYQGFLFSPAIDAEEFEDKFLKH